MYEPQACMKCSGEMRLGTARTSRSLPRRDGSVGAVDAEEEGVAATSAYDEPR